MGFSNLMLLFFITFFALCNAKSAVFNRCYATTSDPYLFMGSRTAYDVGRGNNSITRLPPESKCTPVQIWGYIRHGARYPGGHEIRDFLALHSFRDQVLENHEKKGRGQLCKADLEMLRNWYLDENEMKPNLLAPGGEKELRSIGKRLREAFPEFFDTRNVSQNDFLFKSPDEHRTWVSMESLMEGLFNSKDVVKPVKADRDDPIVSHPGQYCKAWRDSLKTDKVGEQSDQFMLGSEFQNLIGAVSERLGFDQLLSMDTLDVLYEVCRHEKAFHVDRLSVWCSVFSDEEIRLFEYREDMGCYYMAGPGRKINENIGCPSVKNMVQHFRNLEKESKSSTEPKGIFYFSHTVNLASTLTAMGIGKDSPPPLASNYHLQNNRNFRLAHSGPFAGNVIVVFYKCSDAKTPHRVTFHVTERPQRLDGCDSDACDWELIKRKYSNVADSCSVDFCYE